MDCIVTDGVLSVSFGAGGSETVMISETHTEFLLLSLAQNEVQ